MLTERSDEKRGFTDLSAATVSLDTESANSATLAIVSMAEDMLRQQTRVWASGIEIGLRCLAAEPRLGLKRLALPVSYWRTAEFAYVLQHLQLSAGARVFDLGSPKDLAVLLARHRNYAVLATDILSDAVELSRRMTRAQRIEGEGAGRVLSEVQDGRAIRYPSNTFDASVSVSVLEHIPGDGDTAAIRELVRIVKPGGLIVFTVPYDSHYRETHVSRSVYERVQVAREPVFYQRHYDKTTLSDRLLNPADAALLDMQIWGERRVRLERLLNSLPKLSIFLSPLNPLFAMAFLRRLDGSGYPMAAFCTLQKSPNS